MGYWKSQEGNKRMTKRKELERMLKLEEKARVLSTKLEAIQSEWLTMRDSEFLESDVYREHCEENGIARHYNFGDVLA
jgi:hypothetical protein